MNKMNCGDCNQRQLLLVTGQVIYDHLAGKQTNGVYPLLRDDNCYFLAADFDEADWREDAKADLPQPLTNRLIRLAAFQNPEFHKVQAMRLPVWNKPRIIGCAENYP